MPDIAPTASVTVIRASSLTGYSDCARRSAARIFRREVEAAGFQLRELPSGIGAAVGTAVHKGASAMLAQKVENGELPPADVVTDCALEVLREQIAPGVMYDRETPEVGTARRQVQRMTASYRAEIAPQVKPILVEERLEAEVTPLLVLSGQADAIVREPDAVDDLKTGKKLGNHAPQIGSYSLIARSNGLAISRAKITWVPRVPLTKAQPPAQRIAYDLAQAETAAVSVLRHVAADLKTFLDGNPAQRILPGDPWAFIANPSSMLCGSKYCPAWGTAFCREHDPSDKEQN